MFFDALQMTREDQVYLDAKYDFMISMNSMGSVGILNVALSFWAWFTYLTDFNNKTDFWWAWFSVVMTSGLLWLPLTWLWAATYASTSVMMGFLKVFAYSTYAGIIAYPINLVAMWYTFYSKPTESKSQYAKTSDATPYFVGVAILYAVNLTFSYFFVYGMTNWHDVLLVVEASEAELAAKGKVSEDAEAPEAEEKAEEVETAEDTGDQIFAF